jgi:hypothetical protein
LDLTLKDNGTSTDIIISGNIKSISDTDNIKFAITNTWNKDEKNPINLKIDDSFIITSSVIGFLYVKNEELYEMLEDMNLVEVLNVRR